MIGKKHVLISKAYSDAEEFFFIGYKNYSNRKHHPILNTLHLKPSQPQCARRKRETTKIKCVTITIPENTHGQACRNWHENHSWNEIRKDKQSTQEIWLPSRSMIIVTPIRLFICKTSEMYMHQHTYEISTSKFHLSLPIVAIQ